MVKFIVDSTCDIQKEYIYDNQIEVLPLKVLLDTSEYLDGITIQVDEVYDAMRKGIMPFTSQPGQEDMYKCFIELAKKGQEFIYLAFSSALSGTCSLAQSIMKEISSIYPKVNMKVIDSKSGSTATGLILMQTIEFLKKTGLGFKDAVNRADDLVGHIEHVFTITDLNWLIKGGRIGKAQGMIGSILNINPILDVKDGKMEVIDKVRGRKKALNKVVDILEERAMPLKDQVIGISHADDLETANELVEIIKNRLGFSKFIINKIGSVLGSHLGIGGVGIFFFDKDAKLI